MLEGVYCPVEDNQGISERKAKLDEELLRIASHTYKELERKFSE